VSPIPSSEGIQTVAWGKRGRERGEKKKKRKKKEKKAGTHRGRHVIRGLFPLLLAHAIAGARKGKVGRKKKKRGERLYLARLFLLRVPRIGLGTPIKLR